MLRFAKAVLAAGLVLSVPLAARAQTTELKLSHFLPATHGIHKDFLEPWAKSLEEKSGGKVKVTIFAAGSAFGQTAKQLDQVKAGVVDISHGLSNIPRGRLPRTSIMDLPFLTQSADAATRTLWALYPQHLAPEYEGLKVLALHAHNGGLIHTREKKVTTTADLKGLRIRAPSPAVQMMLENLGASPVGMPPTDVYENLQKGVLDGTVFPWDAVGAFKLYEVLKYHLDARAYTTSFFFVMNQKSYEALPADVRKAIDDLSGEALIPKFGPWWAQWDAPGLEAAKARGNEIVPLSNAERAKWQEAMKPVTEAYLADLEKNGVADARQIYEAAKKHTAHFEK